MALLLYPRSNLPRPFRWLCRFPYPCAHLRLWTDVTLRCQMGKTRSRSAAALYAHPWVCTGDRFHDLPQVPESAVLRSHSWPSCIRRFHIRGFYQPRMVNVVVNVLGEKKKSTYSGPCQFRPVLFKGQGYFRTGVGLARAQKTPSPLEYFEQFSRRGILGNICLESVLRVDPTEGTARDHGGQMRTVVFERIPRDGFVTR